MTAKLSKSDKCLLCLEDQAVETPIHIFSESLHWQGSDRCYLITPIPHNIPVNNLCVRSLNLPSMGLFKNWLREQINFPMFTQRNRQCPRQWISGVMALGPPLGLTGLDYLNCLGQEFPNEENKTILTIQVHRHVLSKILPGHISGVLPAHHVEQLEVSVGLWPQDCLLDNFAPSKIGNHSLALSTLRSDSSFVTSVAKYLPPISTPTPGQSSTMVTIDSTAHSQDHDWLQDVHPSHGLRERVDEGNRSRDCCGIVSW